MVKGLSTTNAIRTAVQYWGNRRLNISAFAAVEYIDERMNVLCSCAPYQTQTKSFQSACSRWKLQFLCSPRTGRARNRRDRLKIHVEILAFQRFQRKVRNANNLGVFECSRRNGGHDGRKTSDRSITHKKRKP